MHEVEWEDPRAVLARHGLRANRRFSQNFLVDRTILEEIANVIAPFANETVVEIGPGLGTLTAALLRCGARVHAIEKDARMVAVLGAEFAEVDRLTVVHADALKIDFAALGKTLRSLETDSDSDSGFVVAGNLPYAVTGAILRGIVDHSEHVSRAVFMVQREVSGRLNATPGTKSYGALTVFVRRVFHVRTVLLVGPNAFHPRPKVESAVVEFARRPLPRCAASRSFAPVVKAAFGQRRKTLRNALRSAFDVEVVDTALARAEIDPKVRGETLSVEAFGALARAVDDAIDAIDDGIETTRT